jgi:hypothetical protein
MQDVQLYQQILGLESPWRVSKVELDVDLEEIRVHVGHPRGTKFRCPECLAECRCHDHGEERRWRHLDTATALTAAVWPGRVHVVWPLARFHTSTVPCDSPTRWTPSAANATHSGRMAGKAWVRTPRSVSKTNTPPSVGSPACLAISRQQPMANRLPSGDNAN